MSVSNRKAKMDKVAILNHVVFAFQAKLPCFLAFRFTAESDESLIGNDVGSDETSLDIAVDLSRRFFGGGSLRDCPGSHFVFTCGEETDEIHQSVGGADESIARRFLNADLFQECVAIAFFKLCDFHFNF